LDSDNDLLSYESDATIGNQSTHSLIDASDDDDALPISASPVPGLSVQSTTQTIIICRQCGLKGHAELACSCLVTMKQASNRERHLACGTSGHKAFEFGKKPGCLECDKLREGSVQQGVGHREKVGVKYGGGDGVLYDKARKDKEAEVSANKGSLYEETESPDATGVGMTASGWEEPEVNSAIDTFRQPAYEYSEPNDGSSTITLGPARRVVSGLFEAQSNTTFTTSLAHHRLQDSAPIWETEEIEEVESDAGGTTIGTTGSDNEGQLLIDFQQQTVDEAEEGKIDTGAEIRKVEDDQPLIVF